MSRSRILLADSDRTALSKAGQALKSAGFHVNMEVSVEKAAKRLEKDVFDLVITEAVMGDGLAVVRKVKNISDKTATMILTSDTSACLVVDVLRASLF